MLIERSSEVAVLKAIINVLKVWVKDPVATGVTAKECSTLVIKMAPLEQMRDPGPFDAFLQMIMDIHGEGSVCDATVKQKTEKCFTFGLKSSDSALQRQFFQQISSRAPSHAFGRLKYILGEQEWDGVGDIFWLQHASELMLSIADPAAPLIPEGEYGADSVASLVSDLKTGDLLPALSILVHRSPMCARRLWLDMFPNFWRLLSSDDQAGLAAPLCALLVHDHPPKQQQRRPNVVQVLLESVELCEPRPKISVQYLRYVGKTYNAWHSVLPVLEDLSEQQQLHGAGDMMGDGAEKASEIHAALEELYEALEETDCLHALHRKRCKNPETLYGLSCAQFSFWQKAQDVIHQQMCKGFSQPAATDEQSLLDSFWVQCCRHLNQWDILHEFSRKVRSHDLMLESSWKQQDWTSLKDNLGNPNQADPQQTKIYEVYLSLQENNSQDASKNCMEASQYALKRWIGLSGISAHAFVPLLQKFHTFVELEESCSIIDEVQKAIRVNPPSNHVPDIKPIINAWRDRLPNVWDDLTVWSDIIRMRVNLFRALNEYPSTNNELKQALSTLCNTEIFESSIKFCDAARKHRLLDVTLASLARIPQPKSADLNQSFQLQRQDFKCRFRMSAVERASALIRLNRVDLDKFSTAQRAELLYLKGKFQAKEVSVTAAQESFASAVSMLDSTAKYWVAWGSTYDQQLKATGPSGGAVNSEHGAKCAEHFIRCILRAIRLQPESAKLHLSRVLFLLQSDPSNQSISEAFSSGAEACPSWVWLFLFPQILRIVEGPSRSSIIKILTKVSVDYPHAVFLQIRKLLKSLLPFRQPAPAASAGVKNETPGNGMSDPISVSSTDTSGGTGTPVTPVDVVELDPQQIIMKVWTSLQDHHKSIVKESEIFVNEIIRLRPSSDMNLASTMWTWLDEVGRHDMRNPYPHDMLRSYCDNLLEMCNTANCAPDVAAERARFAAEFGAALNEDFGKSSIMYAATPDRAPIGKDVYRILGKWCGALEKYWSMRDPGIHLESVAPSLLEFKGSQMEFVGQYESLSEPSPDTHFKLDRVLPRGQYVVRHGNCCFRLLFRGSDGRCRPYLVMNVRAMTTDDKWLQYRHIVNNALLKSRQSRARYLTIHSVTSVLITSRLRIVADLERPVNLGQVLRKSLSHTSPPAIALRHIEELISSGSVASAFQSVSLVVPPTLLRDHIAKLMGSSSQMWMLRRAFATHYGLSLIFGYSLCTTPLHADRLTFSLDTGHIFYQEVRPSFDSKLSLKSKYPIPFRFTPNIVSFLQPVRPNFPRLFTSY
jgi:transformation/transcription domain-associated protein